MIRMGVDFGGTKIEAATVAADGSILSRVRRPNPGTYEGALATVAQVVAEAEAAVGFVAPRVGVGIPGSLSPVTGRVRNANSVWINDRPLGLDLESRLGRPVRLRNDANCFIQSETRDGAAAGSALAFGAILGTGCGGGLAMGGSEWHGLNGLAGEWGHTPLPWQTPAEASAGDGGGLACWCGRRNCLETWISGSGFVADHQRSGGAARTGAEIVALARAGDRLANQTLEQYADRLGRCLAVLCDSLDPDVIVLGGGMSNVDELYDALPAVVARHVFSDSFITPILPARHGDSSGVRGAAWLWPLE
jgi:fructokinase